MKNFGQIKNTFNEILAESILKKDKDKKDLFKQYIKLIRENKILRTQFLVYTNIESKIEENENKAYQFIQENIELLKKFKKKDIIEVNEKLNKLLIEWKHPLADVLEGADQISKEEYEAHMKKVNPSGKKGVNRALKEHQYGNIDHWFDTLPYTQRAIIIGEPTNDKNIITTKWNQLSPENKLKAVEMARTKPEWKKIEQQILNNEKSAGGGYSLHENITKLIFTDKTPKNIDSIVESQSQIVDYIKNNKKREITENYQEIPNSLLTSLSVDRFNEKYNDLNEEEKKLFKTVLEGTEESRKELQENIIKECIELVDNQYGESDLEVKEKLLKAKNKLLNMKGNFVSEEFTNNIGKLIDLKKDLSI